MTTKEVIMIQKHFARLLKNRTRDGKRELALLVGIIFELNTVNETLLEILKRHEGKIVTLPFYAGVRFEVTVRNGYGLYNLA